MLEGELRKRGKIRKVKLKKRRKTLGRRGKEERKLKKH